MSRHETPASASAARTARAPSSSAGTPGWRPKGVIPTPMIATSSMVSSSVRRAHWAERERDDFGAVLVHRERHSGHRHLHADPQIRSVDISETRLDAQLARDLDVTDGERYEILRPLAPEVGRVLRQEVLRGPRPQRACG